MSDSRRLQDRFAIGDAVEITFGNDPEKRWWLGVVFKYDPPGIWVQLHSGDQFWVTNGYRIRPHTPAVLSETVIQQLLDLNRTFYNSRSDAFAHSRLNPQDGFAILAKHIEPTHRSLLDVGCGDGRLGRLLREWGHIDDYVGVDFSDGLINIAQRQSDDRHYVRDLLQPDALSDFGRFDIVASLAVFHHIPGRHNRLALLQRMAAQLAPDGLLWLSMWQFLDSERQVRKLRDWSLVGLSREQLEPNDYLMMWHRGGDHLRYVVSVDSAELAWLAEQAGLTIVDEFRSDGREGNLSLYAVLRRPSDV